MATITANQIRLDSKVDFVALGYPEGPDPDTLTKEMNRAVAYVETMTGRVNSTDPLLVDGTALATHFEQAVQLRVEQQITQRQPGFVSDQNENAVDITVPGYSQRRVITKEQNPRDMINQWPELNDLLIALCTEEKLAYWQAMGKVISLSVEAFEEVTDIGWVTEDDITWP